jgi:phosphatidylglycerophosphate synthase
MTSEFGGFLDSVLDRYADILIVLGLTLWSLSHETYSGIWLVGFLAITGTISISYSRARIGPDHRHLFDKGLKSLASRDIRLFLIMLGAVIGQAYFCLIVIAILTNVVVFYRLIYMYLYLWQKETQFKPVSQNSEDL